MLDHNEAHRDEHVLDESLNRLAATGPEFGGGLSNHGPMGAEALVVVVVLLGRTMTMALRLVPERETRRVGGGGERTCP